MEAMSLDEVVAANVRALRRREPFPAEEPDEEVSRFSGMSIADLAAVLGVGEAVVRDMERKRTDRPRREFKWSDLVALCAAFNVTLFDLVLPPEGVEVSDVRQIVTENGDPLTLLAPGQKRETRVDNPDRRDLSLHLFGLVIGDDDVEKLAKKLARGRIEKMDKARDVAALLRELLVEEKD